MRVGGMVGKTLSLGVPKHDEGRGWGVNAIMVMNGGGRSCICCSHGYPSSVLEQSGFRRSVII